MKTKFRSGHHQTEKTVCVERQVTRIWSLSTWSPHTVSPLADSHPPLKTCWLNRFWLAAYRRAVVEGGCGHGRTTPCTTAVSWPPLLPLALQPAHRPAHQPALVSAAQEHPSHTVKTPQKTIASPASAEQPLLLQTEPLPGGERGSWTSRPRAALGLPHSPAGWPRAECSRCPAPVT